VKLDGQASKNFMSLPPPGFQWHNVTASIEKS